MRGDALAATSFRRAPQCLLTLADDGSIIEMSDSVATIWPAAPPRSGEPFWQQLAPDWMERSVEQIHRELSDGASKVEVLVLCSPEHGGERWYEVTVRPQRPPHRGFDILLRDVSEQVRTREALEAERDRRDAIIAHSSDAVMFFRPDCTIEWASPTTARLFGAPPSGSSDATASS